MVKSTTIAESFNIRHGLNGFYNIKLFNNGKNALSIEVYHTVFFEFVPNELDSRINWTALERENFVNQFRSQVSGVWDQPNHISVNSKQVSLKFDVQIKDTAAGAQWRIRVYKLKSISSSRVSSVGRGGASDAELDSNDGRVKRLGNESTQTGIIHEYGHIIGLDDEYKRSSPHRGDRPSIMNWGSTVRDRHMAHFIDWAKPHIMSLPLKDAILTESKVPLFMGSGKSLKADQEVDEVRDWKGHLTPNDVVIWEVRLRATQTPIAVDEVAPSDFDKFEIVFESLPGITDKLIWRPKSAEAVEALFEGS